MRHVAAIEAESLHPLPFSLTEIVPTGSKLLPSGTLTPHILVISLECELRGSEQNPGDNALSDPKGSAEHEFEPGL